MAFSADRRPRRTTTLRPGPELRIGPYGDTGVTLGGKDLRPRPRRRRRSRDPWLAPLLIVLAAFLLAAFALARPAAQHPSKILANVAAKPLGDAGRANVASPTPVFAQYGSLRVHLPVPAEDVTAIAFHQASFNHALVMSALVPEQSVSAAHAEAERLRAAKTATSTPDAAASVPTSTVLAGTDIWNGHIVRLWRSGRGGKPNTAADCGAPAGTPVVAPVDGTVIYVRTYKLYSKYDDYEVHISPTNAPNVDVVLIHISDVRVAAGDRVEAGITRIACVRNLSSRMTMQLAQYTADGGDHTHLQLNRLAGPGSIWVSQPGGPVAVPFAAAVPSSTAGVANP